MMIFAGSRERREEASLELNLSRIDEPRQMRARYLDNYKIIRYCSLTSFVSVANNDNVRWYREIFRKSHRRLFLFYCCRLHVVTTHKKITRCSKFVAFENFPRRVIFHLGGNRKLRRKLRLNDTKLYHKSRAKRWRRWRRCREKFAKNTRDTWSWITRSESRNTKRATAFSPRAFRSTYEVHSFQK